MGDESRFSNGRFVAGGLAVVVVATFLGCGGGSEVAPANPIVRGTGSGSVTLDGVSHGSTELVTSIVNGALPTTVTDRSVTFTTDTVTLHRNIIGQVSVTDTPGTGGTTYVEGVDYQVDRATGVLTRLTTGGIAAGATVFVDYTYRLVKAQVVVTTSSGTNATLIIYNLDPPTGGPVSTNTSGGGPPAGGALGFSVEVETNLLESAGHGLFVQVDTCGTSTDPVDCPARNLLSIVSYDVTNELSTCLEGTLTATVTDANGEPANRSVLSLTFDDPTCG